MLPAGERLDAGHQPAPDRFERAARVRAEHVPEPHVPEFLVGRVRSLGRPVRIAEQQVAGVESNLGLRSTPSADEAERGSGSSMNQSPTSIRCAPSNPGVPTVTSS